MSNTTKGEIWILGEDKRHQQQTFIRQVLVELRRNRRQIQEVPESGGGMGRAFVLKEFPGYLGVHRQRFIHAKSRRLIIALDADKDSVDEIRKLVNDTVKAAKMPEIQPQEGVVIMVPKRAIETWLEYLEGKSVDEETKYPHRTGKEGHIGQAAKAFAALVANPHLKREDVSPSIFIAVEEFRKELLPELSVSKKS